jgi:voltage-gated potassium channel Kch
MAQEIIGFKIEINGQEKVVGSIGEMKKLLKEANFELLAAQKNFGEYSQEAVNAAKKVANLKDSIQEAAETSQLFDPGKKFQAFAGALSAVAGGFTAVQGALGLVGVESENVQKSLLKVQSALALSQGLSTVADSVKDFQRLAAVIQNVGIFQKAYNAATIAAAAIQRAFGVAVTTTSVAFKALRAAIITTGIGALVVGVGLLINKIMEWTESTKQAELAQKALATQVENENALIDVQIAKLTALGGKEDEIYQKRVERIQNELKLTNERLKRGEELTDEEFKQRLSLISQLQVLDIQEENRKKKVAEENAKKAKEEQDRINQEAIKAREAQIAFEEGLEARRVERLQERLSKINAILKTYEEQEEERRKIADEKEKERIEKEKELLNNRVQNNITALRQRVDATNQANQEQIESDRAAAETRAAIQEGYVNLAGELGNFLKQIAGKNKTLQIAGIVAEQAASVARIISGISIANAKAVAASPLTAGQPFVGINTATGVLSIASTIAAAAKGISQVKSSDTTQSVGGTALPAATRTAPIAPVEPLINTRTQLDAGTIQQLGSATGRAYVLESDVTNSQERIRRINRAARLS